MIVCAPVFATRVDLHQWVDTVERVVNATYNMQKQWIEEHTLGWNANKAQRSAQEMFRRIYTMKFLPPGRGLWAMGSPLTEERKLFAALNNCAFVSTEHLKDDPAKPFCFLMDAAMLGVGVGFDVKGAHSIVVKGPRKTTPASTPAHAQAHAHAPSHLSTPSTAVGSSSAVAASSLFGSNASSGSGGGVAGAGGSSSSSSGGEAYVIPDSREGWVEAVRKVLQSYFLHERLPDFDFSLIRAPGTPIKGFGGIASGAKVLQELLQSLHLRLTAEIGRPLSTTAIVDLFNLIGKAVVAGNVRQTAEISFGSPTDPEYLDLKNYSVNPHRASFGWASNNSVFASLGMDYAPIVQRIVQNGEPGLAWLDNMRMNGRMNNTVDTRDRRAMGGNPCLEQTLESYEMCCLVETFPANHTDVEDYLKTLKFAYLYAKTVTLGRTHWPETNRVMLRNRRIGCSMSGIAQFVAQRGLHALQRWCELGYTRIQEHDEKYSEWLAIPRSIKTTSIKPSGTVSLLAGATPGLHFPLNRFYIRRVRFGNNSPLLHAIRAAGYPVEPSVTQPDSTSVVEFPIDAGAGVKTDKDVGMWEQLSLAAFLQRHWADNQVSCTVTFDPVTEGPQLESALQFYQYQLKGVSFLPRVDAGAYPQMPIQPITEADYHQRKAALSLPLRFAAPTPVAAPVSAATDASATSVHVPAHGSIASNNSGSNNRSRSSKSSSTASPHPPTVVLVADTPILDRFCDSDTCQLTAETIDLVPLTAVAAPPVRATGDRTATMTSSVASTAEGVHSKGKDKGNAKRSVNTIL
jgi:ribonucleoside-triphosphate reductase